MDDLTGLVLLQQSIGNANLARDDDAVRGCERFASDADFPRVHSGLASFTIDQIDDFIRYPVADLVRMSLGNRFAGEQIVVAHRLPPRRKSGDSATDGNLLSRASPSVKERKYPFSAQFRQDQTVLSSSAMALTRSMLWRK